MFLRLSPNPQMIDDGKGSKLRMATKTFGKSISIKRGNWVREPEAVGGMTLLHHIELYVSDLRRSTTFWGWLLEELGYTPFQQWESGKSWKMLDTYIVFVQVEERFQDVAYHRCRVGLNHLAFHANSRQHVDKLTIMLKDKGIRILYADKHPHASGDANYAVYFEDPDRIKVELVAPSSDK